MTDEPSVFNQHLLPGNDEAELLTWLDQKFNQAKKARLQFEQQWYLNLAFYFGKQWVQWVGVTTAAEQFPSKLYEPPVPPWRVRLVSNKIRPIIRAELAKITKEKPSAFVMPSTSDDDDIAAARVGEQIYDHITRTIGLNKVIRRAEFWACLTGTGFIKDWYDPNKPDEANVKGSIECEPISPFHIYVPDTQEEDLEKQPHITHLAARDPDWVEETFGKAVGADSSAVSTQLESRFLQALGIQEKSDKNLVAVKEMWIKPCKKFPNGAVAHWAGQTLLNISEEWPFDHKEYPFTKVDSIPTGRFYADSVIVDLIPLQKEYNRTRSQILEAKNRMSKPQLAAVKGSIDPSKMTTEPGLIVFYLPGYPAPTPIPLQNIPGYVIQELERINADMQDIASQHEVSKGQVPPGVTAATAISYLQESDDSKLANAVNSLEEGVEKIGQHFLSHVQQFWDAERTVRVIGDDGSVEAFMFQKSMLKGNTDLRIEAGSAIPRSRAAKQAFIMELFKMGTIPPDKMLKYLDMAETGKLYEEAQRDYRHAQRENIKMQLGGQVMVHDYDNHDAHIAEHNNFRKRQDFDEASEEIQQLFAMHVSVHRQMKAQEMGGMIRPGDPLPGGDPGRPTSVPSAMGQPVGPPQQ